MPPLDGFDYLVEILFEIGPFRGELPLAEENFDSWERRRDIQLEPWEAQMIVELSKEYMGEMHAAKEMSALAPWPKARPMWMHVTGKLQEKKQAEKKTKEPDGNRKRHRNSPPG